MKILVIGGTRFLGYHLTRELIDRGIEVTLFNRGITPGDFGKDVERIKGDRRNYKKFYDTFRNKKYDAVIDLIGYEPEDVESVEETFRGHIGQYLFVSTGQVYLITENKHLPSGEEDYYQKLIPCPPGEELPYEYGLKKREIEDFLEDVYQSRKFPSVRFRCPIIHGPRDYTLRLYSYVVRIADGNPIIIPQEGDNVIRHVYVGDVVRAILSVLQVDAAKGKVYNLAQEEVLKLSEFLRLTCDLMNRDNEIYKVPLEVLNQQRIPVDISPFSGRWVSYMDPGRAQREIGFRSTPLKDWLPETINYFMEEYDGNPPQNYRYRPEEIKLLKNLRKQAD